jgi:hypothetical protein
MLFIAASKKILGINLSNGVKDLYSENYKSLKNRIVRRQ